jgi:undecaprenyl-diphosphatase
VSLLWVAIALGVVEGITEFVPVSSTGHLILAGTWLEFPEEKAAAFEIFIQLGAVVAVVWFYRERLLALAGRAVRDASARAFAGKVLLAFVPAAVVGLVLHDWIVRVLFGALPVAAALAAGGVVLIAIDRPGRDRGDIGDVEDVTWSQALLVGMVQVAALWPGMSRSGATIIGGLLAVVVRAVERASRAHHERRARLRDRVRRVLPRVARRDRRAAAVRPRARPATVRLVPDRARGSRRRRGRGALSVSRR